MKFLDLKRQTTGRSYGSSLVPALIILTAFFSLTWASDPLYLVYPRIVHNKAEITGIAIANPTGEDAAVELYLVSDDGTILETAAGTIPPYNQVAQTAKELFPATFGDTQNSQSAWIFLQSDNVSVVGFFLSLSSDVKGIDGAEATVVGPAFSGAILFPEMLTGPGQTTELALIGFHEKAIPVTLQLFGANGGSAVATKQITIPAEGGRWSAKLTDVFPGSIPAKSYVKAIAQRGLVGYETFGNKEFKAGRGAIPFSTEPFDVPFSLFGPQLAEGFGMTSEITVINPTSIPADVTVSAFRNGPSGAVLAGKRSVRISPNGMIKERARTFLALPAGDFVGWVRVDSNHAGIVGDITFGGEDKSYLSSVQLQKSPVTDVVFSHVADGMGYFTGLTFVNPGVDPVDVQVNVYDLDGNVTGTGTFELSPNEHRPKVLKEIIEGFQPQIGGFVKVSASGGIFTFELFGYLAGGKVAALAAVPPQRGNGTISGTLSIPAVATSTSAFSRFTFPSSWKKGMNLSTNLDFRPGEIVVKYRADAVRTSIATLNAELNLETLATAPENVFLVRSKVSDGAVPMAASGPETNDSAAKLATLNLIERLNTRPEIQYAEPNYRRYAQAKPNDPHYSFQWHYSQLNMEEAWNLTKGSANIIVAVIDTGVRTDHPDLAGRLTGGKYDLITDPQIALDGDGLDNNPMDPGDDPSGKNSTFHGTHVAGTIGAATNNNVGVAGVNWNSPLMSLRALGAGGGTTFDIAQAILYAARLPNASGTLPAKKANVINLSLGSDSSSQVESDAVAAALAQNVSVVASAGNASTDIPHYPAGYPGVISVGAVGLSGALAPYSNYGSRVDVVAPGGNTNEDLNQDSWADGVLSTWWNESENQPSFYFMQGTSMAAPHVTGIVSLLLSVKPTLTPAQIRKILQDTALDLGTPGKDNQYGYGLIDPVAAIKAAGVSGSATPKLHLSTTQIDFGGEVTQVTVTVSNSGGGTLTVNQPAISTTSGGSWMGAILQKSTLTISVDRSGLPSGTYSGTISISSNGGSAQIQVSMQAGAQGVSGPEEVTVLAMDARTFEAIAQAETGSSLSFEYQFSPMPTGRVLILAGTDEDGDGYICDEQDLCGLFPLFSSPELVPVRANEDTSGIDFSLQTFKSLEAVGTQSRSFRRFVGPPEAKIDLKWLQRIFKAKKR